MPGATSSSNLWNPMKRALIWLRSAGSPWRISSIHKEFLR
jgi:hypothetical protein